MRRLFRWIAGVVGVVALAASPQWAAAQAPTDGWDLRRTPESCFLFRSFATVAGKVDVRIQSFGPGTPYHVILHGPGLPLRDNRAEIGGVVFGDQAAAKQTIALIGEANDLPMAIIPARLPSPHPLNLMFRWYHGRGPIPLGGAGIDPTAEQLFVDLPDSAPLTLELGPMLEEYARLESCAQGLADEWARAASGDAHPVSEPRILDEEETLRRVRFPANLSINRISGMVQLRMRVDANGRARDCVAQASTAARQFGEESCHSMEQWARFEPARDAQGNPVNALYRTAIMFVIYNW